MVLYIRLLLFVWDYKANEQVEALQKGRMVKVLIVEFCCGKLNWPFCPLLQSSCELQGKSLRQKFTGGCSLCCEDLIWGSGIW